MGVAEWFSQFCATLRMDQTKRSSLATRTGRITKAVNAYFRKNDSDTAFRFYVGSLGRNTAIPSVSDADLLCELPASIYHQYDAHTGNGQSALLGSVRTAIRATYPTSEIAGDGQVVAIKFTDGVTYEVLPAFSNVGGGYTFADANGGGSWKTCKPKQEIDAFATRNKECNSNLVELGRMARAWRDNCNVPMNGMLIDALAYQFIGTWQYRDKSYLYFDWLTRDFFSFLASRDANQKFWLAPGSGSYVARTGAFEYKARQAELRALEAINHQAEGHEWSARSKYREIYGSGFPA